MIIARFIDTLAWLIPPARTRAQAVAAEVKVRIRANPWGGLSLYPANGEALRILGGHEPTGNFATHADARRRIAWNCWTEAE